MLKAKVIVGRLASVYGVRGWMRVDSFTEPRQQIFDYAEWWLQYQGVWQTVIINEHKQLGQRFIVRLADCVSPEQARCYTNCLIAVSRESLPVLAAEEFYWADLEGLRVVNQQGIILGHVDHILATGSNDVFVLKGERQRLLPYTDEVVKTIDLVERLMVVDWDPDF